jgi:hypothetical protein
MVGMPTPQTGGHRPPRGATPPPQVGARTPPVMAAPPPAPLGTQPQQAQLGPAPAATIQTGPVYAPPPKKSKAVPIAIAAVLLLVAGGYGLSRMLPFGAKAEPAVADAAAVTPPAPTPPAPAPVQQPDGSASTAGNVSPAGVSTTSAPAAAVLQPADGAVKVDPTAVAALNEDAINAEVERRARLAEAARLAQERREAKRRAAAAAAASNDEETVSDDEDSGGGSGTRDAAALRRAYLCRTQRRC